jgi:two-component system, cell cycle sensor histidine kinase and response regulator CckA
MKNDITTNEQLIRELTILRNRLTELEKSKDRQGLHGGLPGGEEIREVLCSAEVISQDEEMVILSHFYDVTERKRSADALYQAENNFRNFTDNSMLGMRIVSASGETLYANQALLDIYGYAGMDELKAIPVGERYTRESLADHNLRREKRKRGEDEQSEYEIGILRKNGEVRHLQVFRKKIIWDGVSQFQVLYQDITERKHADDALRESQRKLADIIEFLPDATLVVDQESRVIAWNRAIEVMTGIKKEDMIGKGNYEYSLPFYGLRRPILIDLALHPDGEMEKRYTAIQRAGDVLLGESFTPTLPPGDIHLSATASVLRNSRGEIVAAIECIRDYTERKRLEERLNRAEKMESLGTLAGGVAHDLNNVLGVLVGYAELLLEKLPDNSLPKLYADNILQSSVRGAAIIQDLLTLARRGVSVSEVVDLKKLVFDYLRTPEFEKLKSYHPDVKIRTEFEEGLLNIKGSPIHLGKTIMNLVANAVEAISGRGAVTIRTANRYLDRPLRGYDEMQEGDYAVLAISDTGSGIPAKDLVKIFEPFYTKKVMGRSGTGLGLAVVWGTVKDHHGYIDVRSEEGKGSTFTLYFPVTREESAKVEKAVSPVAYMSKGESILVVDDIKEQRELATSMMERLGYRVEAVSGGEEAIEYVKNKKADLVVLDMIMDPGMDGLETYGRILEIAPGQKAVIVSGFSETDRVRQAQEMGAGAFVRKPYILEKIGLAVRKELDRKSER